MINSNNFAIASYGEALWDCIPDGLFLGGAPFNAAYHLARLGVQSFPITCVGDDLLGDQVLERAKSAGLETDYIKRHEILETGRERDFIYFVRNNSFISETYVP